MRIVTVIECYGGPLDGTMLSWGDDLPEFDAGIHLRTQRADGMIAAYVSTTRPRGRAHRPARPTFWFLGFFTATEYLELAGTTLCLGLIERAK